MKNFKPHTLAVLFFTLFQVNAQETTVQIDMNVQRYIGDVSELDRTKYFSMHDAGGDAEATTFRNDYNVTGGRYFWGPYSFSKSKTSTVGVYPAYRDGNTSVKAVQEGLIATEHPYNVFLDNIDPVEGADWAVEYYKDFVDNNGRPEYFEVMNEPFVHARDFYSGAWSGSENNRIAQQMSEFYNEVGLRFKNTPELANMKIIGYSAAWPSMELNDFEHWNDNMKRFMDTAGENMYAFSTHLYDGINVTGQDTKRSGSNSEAVLDLIEAYSFIKWGEIKPHAISEYGAIETGYGEDYSDIASVQTVKSINHILFNLLDREDRMEVSIPFITGKATWHINEANNYQPYQAVLWKPTNIGEPEVEGWEYTPRITFYELWKDVKGERVHIKSNNPDIQSHAFVDGTKLFVALSNLDEETQTVGLQFLSSLTNVSAITAKRLKIYDQTAHEFINENFSESPASITLIKDETIVLEYNFNSEITYDNAVRKNTYYSPTYLKSISANTAETFNFNNVNLGTMGTANLRLSIGRKHTVSKKPIVKVNDIAVEVPENWAGYDQANRDDFFGMISIPVPYTILDQNNTVTVTFPDNGGTISSLLLEVDSFDVATNALHVETLSASCRNSATGQINIETYISDNYLLNISGATGATSHEFSSNFSVTDLEAGTYDLVITSATNTEFKEEYSVVISEPEAIDVNSSVNKNEITLNLSGSVSYKVKINDFEFTTRKSSVVLPLEKGKNNISVRGEKECQGVFEKEFFLDNSLVAYPNPFKNNLVVQTGFDATPEVLVTINSLSGNLVYQRTHKNDLNGISIDTNSLSKGVYFIALQSEGKVKVCKVIKQ